MNHLDLSLIIPCYNEKFMLKDSVEQIFKVLDATRFSYEIIFVDDCSCDNTREIIEEIICEYPDKIILKIFHEQNIGRGGSVVDGIKIAKGETAGFIDIDLEIHARYIPSFILAIKDGFDMAVAYRIYKFHFNSFLRYILSRGYIILVRRLLEVDLKDTEAGFKFFNRSRILPIIDEIEEKGWFWDTEIVVRPFLKKYRIKEIPCLFLRNFKKKSNVKIIPDTIYYFRRLIAFRKKIKKVQNAEIL